MQHDIIYKSGKRNLVMNKLTSLVQQQKLLKCILPILMIQITLVRRSSATTKATLNKERKKKESRKREGGNIAKFYSNAASHYNR